LPYFCFFAKTKITIVTIVTTTVATVAARGGQRLKKEKSKGGPTNALSS
jgi:hypothetical protein